MIFDLLSSGLARIRRHLQGLDLRVALLLDADLLLVLLIVHWRHHPLVHLALPRRGAHCVTTNDRAYRSAWGRRRQA